MIIIDEWDALFREAPENTELQKIYIQLLRALFKGIQVSRFLCGAYMTGILPIKKYGTQSALTDFTEFTMLEPGPLAPYVGFTEDEVKSYVPVITWIMRKCADGTMGIILMRSGMCIIQIR